MSDETTTQSMTGDGTTTGTEQTTTTTTTAADQSKTTTSETDTTKPAVRADGKPMWLPEKFKSEEDLSTSYKELERKQFQRREEIKAELAAEASKVAGVPEAPDGYKFEPFKTSDGREFGVNAEDPVHKLFQGIAFDLKLPQDKYQKVVKDFILADAMRGPQWPVEAAKLGEAAELRIGRVDGWMKGNAPQEVYDAFARLPATADLVKMFEHVMTLSGEPAFQPSETPAGFTETVTKESLQAMQRDPRYYRTKDPIFRAQVSAGFRKLASQK
jgi:hypothetical protein